MSRCIPFIAISLFSFFARFKMFAIAWRQWADISPVDWHVSIQTLSQIPSVHCTFPATDTSRLIGQQIAFQSVDLNNKERNAL